MDEGREGWKEGDSLVQIYCLDVSHSRSSSAKRLNGHDEKAPNRDNIRLPPPPLPSPSSPIPHCLRWSCLRGSGSGGDSPAAEAGTAAVAAAAAEATTVFFVWQCVMYGRSLALLLSASRSDSIARNIGSAFVTPAAYTRTWMQQLALGLGKNSYQMSQSRMTD